MRLLICLGALPAALLTFRASEAAGANAPERVPQWRPGFQAFEVRAGKETALCQAYVEMLRSIEFQDSPYCSRRPDLDHRRLGFETLGWRKLEPRTELELRLVVPGYFATGRLDYLQKEWSSEERMRAINPKARSYMYQGSEGATARERYLKVAAAEVAESQRASLSVDTAYELAAPVDIDNDGSPERVVIWPSEGHRCGAVTYKEPLIFGRNAVVLQPAGGFDPKKTGEVLRHADNYRVQLRDPASGKLLPYDSTRPRYLVRAITVTKYQGRYLFDGLMTRDSIASGDRKDKKDSIGVFEHRHGITAMRCEIGWQGAAPR